MDFSVDSDLYNIDVSRRATLNVNYKNGEDISSHTATNTYKTLNEILVSILKHFHKSFIKTQMHRLQFLTATDTNRKKFLIDLLQLDEVCIVL